MTYAPAPARRRPSRWLAPAAIAVVLVVAGIGIGLTVSYFGSGRTDTGGVTPASLVEISASIAALPKCATLFVPGQVIDEARAANGCLDPDGGVQLVGGMRCNDGRHLWYIRAYTGAQEGFGFGGAPYQARTSDAATDGGYGPAYHACNG